jgi:hypothetical protein
MSPTSKQTGRAPWEEILSKGSNSNPIQARPAEPPTPPDRRLLLIQLPQTLTQNVGQVRGSTKPFAPREFYKSVARVSCPLGKSSASRAAVHMLGQLIARKRMFLPFHPAWK